MASTSSCLSNLKMILHGFEIFRGVPLPICDLARDPNWIPRELYNFGLAGYSTPSDWGHLRRAGRFHLVDAE